MVVDNAKNLHIVIIIIIIIIITGSVEITASLVPSTAVAVDLASHCIHGTQLFTSH